MRRKRTTPTIVAVVAIELERVEVVEFTLYYELPRFSVSFYTSVNVQR